MLALLQDTANQVPLYLQEREAWANSFQAIATPILILVGGFFAWWKFFRRGEHRLRLQPAVTATVEVPKQNPDTVCVFATITAQNSGEVEAALVPEGSALVVWTTTLEAEGWQQQFEPIKVFVGQDKVRPGETLQDNKLIQIEYSNEVAVRLDLTVTATDPTIRKVKDREPRTWDTIEMVSLLSSESGQPAENE